MNELRQRPDDMLQAEHQMFQSMAETFSDIVFTALPDGAWDYTNARMVEITGLSGEAALGHGWTDAVHPEDRERVMREIREAYTSGTLFESQFRLQTLQGGYRRFVARAQFLFGDAGEIARWIGSATDVHDLLTMEDELNHATRRNSEFVSTLRHDLRNVLAPMLYAVALLRTPGVDAAQKQRAVEIIDAQVRDLRLFVDSLHASE